MEAERDPAVWLNLTPGKAVQLRDSQAMETAMKEGGSIYGIDYVVQKTQMISSDLGIRWAMHTITDQTRTFVLLVKAVDNECELRVYFAAQEFVPGNRADVIGNGASWLFNDPGKPDYTYQELTFVPSIVDEPNDLEYKMKPFGTLECQTSLFGEDCRVLLSEYVSGKECLNPEILVTETGGDDREAGGLIEVFVGKRIAFEEIEIIL